MPSNPVPPSPLASQGTRGATTLTIDGALSRLEDEMHLHCDQPLKGDFMSLTRGWREILTELVDPPASPPSAEAPTTGHDRLRTIGEATRQAVRENTPEGGWQSIPDGAAVPPSADAGETTATTDQQEQGGYTTNGRPQEPLLKGESTMQTGEFHNRDGWFFSRAADGSVCIQKRTPDAASTVEQTHNIPPNEWLSIVAHVSASGETATAYEEAGLLHGGDGLLKDVREFAQIAAAVYPDGSLRVRATLGSIPARSFGALFKYAKRVDSPASAFDAED